MYKCSKVSGKGDLKYSSRANNNNGFNVCQLLHDIISSECQEAKRGRPYLINVKKGMPRTYRHCLHYSTSTRSQD